MALVFPGGPAGVFDVLKPAQHWNCAGDEIRGDHLPQVDAYLLVRLNALAVGEALFVAGRHNNKTIVWQWCVVNKTGDQHVYHATAEQASNGSGGARIEGVKSLAQWLGAVTRKPHAAKRATKDPETAIARARAVHAEIVDMVCARGCTQRSSDGVVSGVCRGLVLNRWDDALDALEALKTLDANAPDRTDRRPTPRE